MGGAPKFAESQTVPCVDYAGFAKSLGLRSMTLDDPADIGEAWEQALSADRPTVLDVHVDPDVPPIPPHASLDQMVSTVKALVAGDEDRYGVVKEGLKIKSRELLHHSGV